VPDYAVPDSDIRGTTSPADPQLSAPDPAELPPILGPESFEPGTVVDLSVGDRVVVRAGFVSGDPDLDGLVVLDFASFDRWLAEDEEPVGHPHDPFKCIDVLRSQRHAEDSRRNRARRHRRRGPVPPHHSDPQHLRLQGPRVVPLDHGWPGCWTRHRVDLPRAAGRRAACARPHAFWNERTDIRVDGELQPRPVTPRSTPAEHAATDVERLEFG
jgi:hypothetical protein